MNLSYTVWYMAPGLQFFHRLLDIFPVRLIKIGDLLGNIRIIQEEVNFLKYGFSRSEPYL